MIYPGFACRVCRKLIDDPRRPEHLDQVCGPCQWRAARIAHVADFCLPAAERERLLAYVAGQPGP